MAKSATIRTKKTQLADEPPVGTNTISPSDKVRIVSLFSGAGGLEIAACRTGKVEAIVSTDSNATFLSTVEKNLPIHFPGVRHNSIVADAKQLQADNLKKLMGSTPDIVMGGPPCDDYTQFGKRRGFEGDKGPLIFHFLRLVDDLKPACFIFENVPNLARQFKDIFQLFLEEAQNIGYFSKWSILKACDYGSPTKRARVFVVGWRERQNNETFHFPSPNYGDPMDSLLLFPSDNTQKPYVNVKDVLDDLPDTCTPEALSFLNHTGRPHRAKTIEHMKTVPAGKKVSKSFRYRAPWDGLCVSLTAGVDHATKSYLHPHFHREMSVREYARIHSFEDTWEFMGTHHNGVKQVANSVPIPLGEAVIAAVIQNLTSQTAWKKKSET